MITIELLPPPIVDELVSITMPRHDAAVLKSIMNHYSVPVPDAHYLHDEVIKLKTAIWSALDAKGIAQPPSGV